MNSCTKKWVIGFWGVVAIIFNIVFLTGLEFIKSGEGNGLFMSFGAGNTGLFIIIILLSLVLMMIGGVVWIIMLVHAVTKPIPNKAFWLIVLVLGWVFSAAVYYYCVKKKLEISSEPQIIS